MPGRRSSEQLLNAEQVFNAGLVALQARERLSASQAGPLVRVVLGVDEWAVLGCHLTKPVWWLEEALVK